VDDGDKGVGDDEGGIAGETLYKDEYNVEENAIMYAYVLEDCNDNLEGLYP
jgi:hypothetical protein